MGLPVRQPDAHSRGCTVTAPYRPDPSEQLEPTDALELLHARLDPPLVVPPIPAYESEYNYRQDWNHSPEWRE